MFFHKSCDEGDLEIASQMVSGVNLEAVDKENGWTPLYTACRKGHLSIAKLLVEKGADANATSSTWPPIYGASFFGHLDVVKFLHEQGADINKANHDGASPSLVAADFNKRRKDGASPVFFAARNGHLEVLKCLIHYGANVNAACNGGETPAYIACAQNHANCLKLLIDAGANINLAQNGGETPAYVACSNNHPDCLKVLAAAGANFNIACNYGETPAYVACLKNYPDCLRVLISAGANVNLTCNDGETPAYIACYQNHPECLKMLIDANANVNLVRDDGETAAYVACYENHPSCLKMLIEAGADINLADNTGKTPIYIAYQMNHLECLRVLKDTKGHQYWFIAYLWGGIGTKCDVCSQQFGDKEKQGYECKNCGINIHEGCMSSAPTCEGLELSQIEDWLSGIGLQDSFRHLKSAGLQSKSDLECVDEKFLESIGIPPFARRRFLQHLPELNSSNYDTVEASPTDAACTPEIAQVVPFYEEYKTASETTTQAFEDVPFPTREMLMNAISPWQISRDTLSRERDRVDSQLVTYIELTSKDPEWQFVNRYFNMSAPQRKIIKKIKFIDNRRSQREFVAGISSKDAEVENPIFRPNWENEENAVFRSKVIGRWRSMADRFSPFEIHWSSNECQIIERAKLLPLWQGSSYDKCDSISKNGFTYFGVQGNSISPSTDVGFYGKGMYFTNSAKYAASYSHDGNLMLAWVCMREPYPAIFCDGEKLRGKGKYGNYDAHFIPVSNDIYFPSCPCGEDELPTFDEFVVFDKSQALPWCWVQIE